jgi:hypothetical protein
MDADLENPPDGPQPTGETPLPRMEVPSETPPEALAPEHADDECPERAPRDRFPADETQAARRERIAEHRWQATLADDPLLACLSSLNADVFEVAMIVSDRLRQALGDRQAFASGAEECGQLTELFLRLAKQNAQLTQLERGLRKAGDDGLTPSRIAR